jgi:Zn-dependent M28 family amino/carboxypeptidase
MPCAVEQQTTAPQAEPAGPTPGLGEAAGCIDGERALEHIGNIIALGPRHAGAPGAEQTRTYILSRLTSAGLEPRRHDFIALTPHPDLPRVEMANIAVDIAGPGDKGVLLGGHFDGKLIEGVDFQGANDGGSSTALLLEMARCLAIHPPAQPVRLVFFDGEEALVRWSENDSLYGSKWMAGQLKSSGEVSKFSAAVIVDMIGDKRLQLFRDRLSTPWVYATLAKQAQRLGYHSLLGGPLTSIEDDHIPLKEVGIPAAVLIDLAFGPGWQSNAYWHTSSDTIDKVSAASIEAVGQIVLTSLDSLASGPAY